MSTIKLFYLMEVPKKRRYRKDKPWDNDPTLDKWKIPEMKPGDM
jgi:ribosomal RNA assembly protein